MSVWGKKHAPRFRLKNGREEDYGVRTTDRIFRRGSCHRRQKGGHLPDRSSQVAMMAQMQNMFDFPPAPKLNIYGKLDPDQATEEERASQELFFGKARCSVCHPAPFYLDDKMHDLKVERFYTPQMINAQRIAAEGPIKTFTLRGIKDSPPFVPMAFSLSACTRL